MQWLQVKFILDQAIALSIEDLIYETGALAITLNDPEQQGIFELYPGMMPLWDKIALVILYPGDSDPAIILQQLQQIAGADVEITAEIIADQDWHAASKQQFKPIHIGQNFWICPSWETPPTTAVKVVVIDPQLAFGTGNHPTTALCLEWLVAHLNPGQTVVDFGCGSGILGITAAKLAAAKVYCVDYDPPALASTLENAQKNNLDLTNFKIYAPEDLMPNLLVDVVVANILAAPLQELAAQLAAYLANGGRIVLSGILSSQAAAVVATYQTWFQDLTIVTRGEWVRITGVKNADRKF